MCEDFRLFAQAALILLVLPACQSGSRSVLVTRPELHLAALPDRCGVAELADLRGHSFTAMVGRKLVGDLRVIRWIEAVTPEIEPRRINAMVDEMGIVIRFFCG